VMAWVLRRSAASGEGEVGFEPDMFGAGL